MSSSTKQQKSATASKSESNRADPSGLVIVLQDESGGGDDDFAEHNVAAKSKKNSKPKVGGQNKAKDDSKVAEEKDIVSDANHISKKTAKLSRRPSQKLVPMMVLIIEWTIILQNSRVLAIPLNHYDPSILNRSSTVDQVYTSLLRTRRAPTELIPTLATMATYFPSLEVRIEMTTTARPLVNHRKSPALLALVLVAARAIHSGNLTILLQQINAPAVISQALARMFPIGIPNQTSTPQGGQMAAVMFRVLYPFVSRIVIYEGVQSEYQGKVSKPS